jgi:NAD(P)-dependent dehydrogenase (short-subunit alcohol dehydrogenase family)
MTMINKVAIVTGGSRGIGRAISLRLAGEGIHVVIASRDLEVASKVASEINTAGNRATAIKTDVTDYEDVTAMTKRVLDELGSINILVNNAGGSPHETRTLFHESKEKTWDTVLNVNLKGVLICTRAVINHMIQRQSGKVINIGSIAGLVGTAGLADYSAAKGGIIAFSKALAKEVAPYHINVNCVCPGPIATDYFLTLSEDAKQRYLKTIPFGRFGEPEEVAGMVNYLASSEADFITGQVFTICGGRSLGS